MADEQLFFAASVFMHTIVLDLYNDSGDLIFPKEAVGQWQSSMTGKATVGSTLHRPCITDSVVYPPTGSVAEGWQMSTAPL